MECGSQLLLRAQKESQNSHVVAVFADKWQIHSQGFFQDFRQEGANVTIVELRGGMYYCCIFQGFCHRGNVIAHS